MKTNIDVFTGHYTDNVNKVRKGVSFGAVIERDGRVMLEDKYSIEGTYMTIWLDGVLSILKQLEEVSKQRKLVADLDLTVRVYMCHKNVYQIARKMQDVFDELKVMDCDVTALLARKMHRKNRSKYDYHDTLIEIVTTLLTINRNAAFDFRFNALPPSHKSMRTAQQHADIVHEAANAQPNVVRMFR